MTQSYSTSSSSSVPVFFGNKTYNVLKWITQIILPALGTLYFALAGLWDLPKADEVVGTIVAVVTFLGVVLGFSSYAYNRSDAKFSGDMEVIESEHGGKTYSLDLNEPPENLQHRDEVTFKVRGNPNGPNA